MTQIVAALEIDAAAPLPPQAVGLTDAEVDAVRRPLAAASLLPPRVYIDPETFRIEREKLFPSGWMPVCHVSDLEAPGAYVARHLVGEPVFAVRDRQGDIRIFSNVCRHRNTTLVSGQGTCKGNRIVCPYHGWTYGLDGGLLAAPFMNDVEGFVRRDIGLPELRHEVWHGFVFVNIDGKAAPLAETLAELEPMVAPYGYAEMERFELKRVRVPWNWKISLENFSEAYHQPWVHPESAEKGFPADKAVYYENPNNAWSLFRLHERDNEIYPLFAPAIPSLDDAYRRFVSVFNIYPYFHCLSDAATPLLLDFNIFGPEDHEMVWSLLLPRGTRETPDLEARLDGFRAFIEPIMVEDVEVCTGIAAGVQSRFTRAGRLSLMERAVHQFHNWWLDRMLAPDAT